MNHSVVIYKVASYIYMVVNRILRNIILFFLVTATIFAVITGFFVFSMDQVANIYMGKTKEAILDVKKEFLKETVDNLITRMDSNRDTMMQYAVNEYSRVSIDVYIKAQISQEIKKLKFSDGEYIWVNEILNYRGGTNFAIRRIHPALPETEGMYLSTTMKDEKGNYPYLTEIQGLNKKGELFFMYYFKEPKSNHVSLKLTYAKLYKKFNWSICMGVYIQEVEAYADQINSDSKAVTSRIIFILVIVFVIILVTSYTFIIFFEKTQHRRLKNQLESEINEDALTKAASRRNGVLELNKAFKNYRKNSVNSAVLIFDVDYFKTINDTYGHAVGDIVLVEIVNSIQHVIRSTDKLIRWGGDEFILIFQGLQEKYAHETVDKILTTVSSLKITVGDVDVSTSLSMGVSFFMNNDNDYNDVINRADRALYTSKIEGRNRVNFVF